MDKKALRDLSYGVYILASTDGSRPVGCVANSAMQVTSEKATVAVSVNHDNFTNSCIKKSGLFSLSILSENADPKLIGSFGFKSSKDIDKFDGVSSITKSGVEVISSAKSFVVCRVEGSLETDTHTVFLGEVIDAGVFNDETPMTYDYYHRVIKGKAPKNAPTYEEEEKKEASQTWKCQICGYEASLDTLPEDFVCPVCGVAKELFTKT